jgi:serine/threonine protein kinase
VTRKLDMGTHKDPALQMNFYPLSILDLMTYEIESKLQLPVYLKRRMFYSIVLGLELCHQAGYAHMDLKCDNILLSDRLVPTLCDFGLARHFIDVQFGVGYTERYAAPEILNAWLRLGGYDWRKSDLWTLGTVLFEMMFL